MTDQPTEDRDTRTSHDEVALYIDQARWLLEWHGQRSEALAGRAVAVLGFTGVVLALLLQGAGLKGIDASGWTWTFLVLAIVSLLGSGLFALLAIAPATVAVPHVQQLRKWWREHAADSRIHHAGPNIAESLLHSGKITEESAVSSAKEHADGRAARLGKAIWCLFAAFVFIALLLGNVLNQAWRG